jgi:hypothetical protein
MDNKRLAIENHSTSIFDGSVTSDVDNRRSRSYRIPETPYGMIVYFQDFVFYAELIQQGKNCDSSLLNRLYPIGYVDPSTDYFGRQAIKLIGNLPVNVKNETIESAIGSYIKTVRFRSICDSFKLTVSVAILDDGSIVTGNAARNIYNKAKNTYHDKKVLTCWIPYTDRPDQLYKNRRDSKLTNNLMGVPKKLSFKRS